MKGSKLLSKQRISFICHLPDISSFVHVVFVTVIDQLKKE